MHHIVNGDYMYRYSAGTVLLFMVDIILLSLLYVMIGLFFSAWFNDEIISYLDRSLGNLVIFIQVMAEMILNIIAILLIIHFVPKIPSIVPDAPPEHLIYRTRGGDVLIVFALVSAQLLYRDKIVYLYNEIKDSNIKTVEEILSNWEICQDGSVAQTGEFSCQV